MSTKIEEEVFLHTFRNEYHKGIVNLVYTYGFVQSRLQQLFSEHGLTMQQFNILRILRGSYPDSCSNTDIKERMLDKNSDVTRIVNRLINQNLVERRICPDDKRKVEIRIKDDGLKLLSEIDARSDDEDAILENLNEHEIYELNRLLDKIRGIQRPKRI
ncbi:MAG: MarR family transcriptional regulator [Candidatus Cyclonatronum sp.]|uniref:MarR family winged helix-turn-helix transcriptional regulator n=1 Tax=Cyclonatronum sp. TaxID=3024185 RepID=UPI0025BFDC49|nr:MarR family transcriptional regulator [Cyclonatronum sp.]MCC5934753.1 MarR family transcriptional regulator [Balneolales bacterium]MCH8487401.1 MarR family transcriptional regulator [Cyclonatronum sp.]